MSEHEPYCEGGHVASISCADATAWREHERANPWHCWSGRSGYHMFGGESDPPPDQKCLNEGCDRTWGELEVTLIGRH